MRRWRASSLSLLALAPATIHGQAELPYNPTRILYRSNSSYAYVFGPSSSSSQAQLSAFDVSKPFAAGEPQLSTISMALPFLQDGNGQPYAPMMDAGGNITVLSGDCTQGSREAQVWQFEPDQSDGAQGTWTQYRTLYAPSGKDADYAGPGYLANSIAFSNSIDGTSVDSSVYVFGGMCPDTNSTAATWISAAQYSNSMLTISPDASNYDIGLLASRESPISQAGSAITPLPPTFGLNSSGLAQTQQQDFVLTGGNTQNAFINMSQVALFSLPQQSWSYLDVLQPTGGKADLAVKRQSQQVEPRSGHTAVLSEKGDSIVVFGGWVANVDTPAQPQLAILELGAGYGGTGEWKWTVPDQSGDGLPLGTGVYGHGAVMLPGGIMMVLGGYEISAPSTSKYIRRATQSSNNQVLLFNTTSNSWVKTYSPPANSTHRSTGSSGPLDNTGEKVGLATGLGVGAALLVTMVGFYVWYARRVRRAREERDTSRLSYNSESSMLGYKDQAFGNLGADGDDLAAPRYWPGQDMGEQPNYRSPAMQLATGAFVNVPSPTRGLRKGSIGRNYQYHAAPRQDEKRRNRGSGNIHPIAEDANEDEQRHFDDKLTDAERRLQYVERVLSFDDDPFVDPDPHSYRRHPNVAAGADTVRRVPTYASQFPIRKPVPTTLDMANWTVEREGQAGDLDEDDGEPHPYHGEDRTNSTLSERSGISNGTMTRTISNGTMTRTMSTKTGQMLAAAFRSRSAHSLQTSPVRDSVPPVPPLPLLDNTLKAGYFKPRARSNTAESQPRSPSDYGGDSFLPPQAESEALMRGRRTASHDDPYQLAVSAHHSTRDRVPQAAQVQDYPTPPPIPPRRRPGLMGSLQRALNAVSIVDRSWSLTGTNEHYTDGVRTSSSSPTKDRPNRSATNASPTKYTPRRAVSDGAALLRQKRGEKDWNADEWPPYRDNPMAGDWGEPPRSSSDLRQAEEDWDVEGAAGKRDFQVMFSVPKSKLRVVNDDMDRASLRSASDGVLSRNGSLRREGSIKPLKGLGLRREGDRLPSTEEEIDGMGESENRKIL